MAPQVSALALLLALPPLLSAQRATPARPSSPKTPDTCRREGPWTTKVMFPSEQTVFRVNDTVLVMCAADPESGLFPAKCTELKDRGAVWDISGVKCLRMCNDWVRQVDFDPAQTEFGVGAEGRVTCRQQFQQNSFSVTCRETEPGRFEWDWGANKCVRKCKIPRTWDPRLQFAPKGPFYSPGDSVTLSCSEGYRPSPPVIECVRNGSQSVWSETPTCQGVCTTAGNWPPSVSADSAQTEFAVGERVHVTCRPEQYEGRPAWMRCTETAGRVEWDTSRVSCVEKCRKPSWASALRFEPDKTYYSREESVTLSCAEGFEPSQPVIRCTGQGNQSVWNQIAACLGMCNDWMRHVDFDPAQMEFGVGAKGWVTCRQEFQQNSFSVTCRETKSGRFEWDLGAHTCVRKCEIPRAWDSRLQFAPKKQFYSPGELVTLSCPEGYRPSPPVIICARNGSQPVWSDTPTCQQGEAQMSQPGGLAVAVAVPVVLVLLGAGALLLWFVLARNRQAAASRPAKDAGEALYTELQPRDTPDIYCTIQTPEHGAADELCYKLKR